MSLIMNLINRTYYHIILFVILKYCIINILEYEKRKYNMGFTNACPKGIC